MREGYVRRGRQTSTRNDHSHGDDNDDDYDGDDDDANDIKMAIIHQWWYSESHDAILRNVTIKANIDGRILRSINLILGSKIDILPTAKQQEEKGGYFSRQHLICHQNPNSVPNNNKYLNSFFLKSIERFL